MVLYVLKTWSANKIDYYILGTHQAVIKFHELRPYFDTLKVILLC